MKKQPLKIDLSKYIQIEGGAGTERMFYFSKNLYRVLEYFNRHTSLKLDKDFLKMDTKSLVSLYSWTHTYISRIGNSSLASTCKQIQQVLGHEIIGRMGKGL